MTHTGLAAVLEPRRPAALDHITPDREGTPMTTNPEAVAPSARAGLRDEIAAALEAADYRMDMRRGDLADAVMPVLYRAWPWLRAEAEDEPAAGVRQPDTETQRRQTVEYFVQSEQPDGTWESASSFSTDAAFAAARLSARRQMMPDLTLRLAERTTTVTVQPLPDCLACRHWCCNGDGPCGALLSAWERCTCPGPAVSGRPAADDSSEETP